MTSVARPAGGAASGTPDPAERPATAPRAARPTTLAARPNRTVVALYARLIRRSTALLAVAMAAYVALEIASYRSAYPDGISPLQFQMFEDNPAVRMLSGAPYALDTAAGFALWDAGWLWQLLLAVWAILTTTRFLRGEEDVDRADLVLSAPVRATRVTALALAVVGAAGLIVGAVAGASMVVAGEDAASSVMLSIALAGVAATFASVAAVSSQLVEVRRRAAALATAALGLAFLVRMVASSADERAWLGWLTPLGWLEQLHLYGEPEPLALLPLLLTPVMLGAAAIALRARRDTGAALLVPESSREPRLRLLGSPVAFAWRSNRAILLAWILGLAAYGAIMGALISTMIDWLAGDEGYQRILADMGLDEAMTNKGFLAFIATLVGLAVALQASWRVGAARAEEETGRIDAILARPVTRLRWLGGHAALTLLGAVLLLVVVGTTQWLGAAAVGSADITWWDTMRAALNVLPVVVLIAGLALCAFGLLPRLTVAVPVTVAVVGFVLAMLGPALDWPQQVLDLSPFTHLALVPAEPWAATAGTVMTAMGLALGIAGLLAFRRRDIVAG